MRNYETHVYSYTEKSAENPIGIRVVKAVTMYDGKSVSACAKCDPDDAFDLELGTKIALKRLDIKIAKKRQASMQKYIKFCEMDLGFIEQAKKRAIEARDRARVAAADRKVELKELEIELSELLNNI